MKNNNETAVEAYQRNAEDIYALLHLLAARLSEHREQFNADAKNWAKVGDIGHVRSRLVEVAAFMHSMDEADIEAKLKAAKR